MFTIEQRDQVQERVLDLLKHDQRVTGAALTGSSAVGAADRWSDIDLAFGIVEGTSLAAVLADWTTLFEREWGVLHHWDLPYGASIYRVFLLPDGLEIDVSVTPQSAFGPRSPSFRLLFGTAQPLHATPPPDPQYLIGLAWHHVLHARAAIERGKPWRAEYWISALRDHTLALACLRLGESAVEARGIDRLPASVTAPLAAALVRSLDTPELRRALAVATARFLAELESWDPELCAKLKPLLQELGTSPRGQAYS